MLGQLEEDTKKKTYLSIAHGKVVHYRKEGGIDYYKNIAGYITDVYRKERIFNGNKCLFWYIDIVDGEEIYSISLPFISGTFKSIILALANDRLLNNATPVTIEPYEKNGYTKVAVYADGVKLDWITKDLPPLKQVVAGNRTFTDDTDRMAFICDIADKVKERVQFFSKGKKGAKKAKK